MKEKRILLSNKARKALNECNLHAYATFCEIHPPAKPIDRTVYLELKNAVLALDGTWNSTAKCFSLPASAEGAIVQARKTGFLVNRRQTNQEFFTPPLLAAEIASLIWNHRNVHATHEGTGRVRSVLEPSAGQGAIVQAILDGHRVGLPIYVTAIEKEPTNACRLPKSQYVYTHVADFTTWAPNFTFDAVAMNPPFANREWRMHVHRALSLLKEGGILVAVVPGNVTEEEVAVNEVCVLKPVNAKFDNTAIKVQLLVIIKGCKSKSEVLLSTGIIISRTPVKPKALPKLKSPKFYLKQIRKDLEKAIHELDEVKAML